MNFGVSGVVRSDPSDDLISMGSVSASVVGRDSLPVRLTIGGYPVWILTAPSPGTLGRGLAVLGTIGRHVLTDPFPMRNVVRRPLLSDALAAAGEGNTRLIFAG